MFRAGNRFLQRRVFNLEKALLVFFGTSHAVARPGNGFEALLLKFLFAFDATAIRIPPDAFERIVDQRQHGPIRVGLSEQKFLGVRVRSLVGKVHRRIVVRSPAFFFGPGNGLDQFLSTGLQFFLVIIQSLLIHSRAPLFTQLPILQTGDCRPALRNCQGRVAYGTPNGSEGSIWQSGGGLAADTQGKIYALIANGTFDTTLDANNLPSQQDYGNAFVKISTTGGNLKIADYFNMSTTVNESGRDIDLGSGGPMILPDQSYGTANTLNLAVGAGKDGNLYVVNRNSMGKFSPTSNNVYQELPGAVPNGVFGVPAYFDNKVFYCDVNATLKSFRISNGKLSATPVQTGASFTYPGVLPSVSAEGTSNGIVWAIENTGIAVLHAFAANDLTRELYNSDQASGGRDHFGSGNKFITPMVADGRVFAATTNGVAMFGLLP